MTPILYSDIEISFENNGIGPLSDAISCTVKHEINGEYDLTMQYPITGIHYNDIALRCAIVAKPDKITDPQVFRVYRITKPLNGVVTIYAHHLVYDLSGIPVSPFTASGVTNALAGLKNNAAITCPFFFTTTKTGGATMTVSAPASIFSLMGGTEGSIIDLYGGEYDYDNYTINLSPRLGADNGVSIVYGKNLTSLDQDANCADCYTGIYPYWQQQETIVQLTNKIVNAPGTYNYTKILPVNMTEKFDAQPTEAQLQAAAETYVTDNNIGVPTVSWKVEFVALEDTEEYKGQGFLERISLGDTVTVEFAALGVDAQARAVSVEWDVLLDRYNSITLGSVKANLAYTVSDQGKEIAEKPSTSLVEQISSSLASAIMGANGGSVRLLDTNNDGEPDTLYIADNPDPAQAVKVWRFNFEGWAASENGYNGPFTMGATLDDGIMANLINVSSLFAENITMTGTFTNTTEAFFEPNYAVQNTIINYLLGRTTIPPDQIWLYDFNEDGAITGTDLIQCQSAILGTRPLLGNWSKAENTPVTCTINLSDPDRAIVLSGTDMWGNNRESCIGIDPSQSTFATKAELSAALGAGLDTYSLGSSLTTDQLNDIWSGAFELVRPGGYWDISGRRYYVADVDYFYGLGQDNVSTHHAVVVPGTSFSATYMFRQLSTAAGYYGSNMKTNQLNNVLAAVQQAFGANNIVSYNDRYVNGANSGTPTSAIWATSKIDLMTEPMVFGSRMFSSSPINEGICTRQLKLFADRPDVLRDMAATNSGFWLRDIYSNNHFCLYELGGIPSIRDANQSGGTVPFFLVG